MPINPIQFAHQICDEFLRYIHSAFPLADPALKAQARKLLDRPSSLDMPLVRGPYVTLSEAFARGESVREMADRGDIHRMMPGLMGHPRLWKHQQQVFEAVRRGDHVLVSTGTGSGKTEAFLYPIVDDLLRRRDAGETSGLAAILVYPMNALANDQLDRLRDMLAGTGVTFGQWIGITPRNERDVTIDRSETTSREGYQNERRRRREEAAAEDKAARPLAPAEECCSEEAIRDRQPRILVTNYRQLEILTTRWPDVDLFADAPLKYLVFDEAHTYDGAVGAEVACLIRRVRALARKRPKELICIGTSATLTNSAEGPESTEIVARRFASRFFGVDSERVAVVGESYVERQWPRSRHRPAPPTGEGMARLSALLKAIAEPEDVEALARIIEELTGKSFAPGDDWRASLFDHLIGNELVFQATQILKLPRLLSEAGWLTSQRVEMNRLPEGDTATAELLCYLVLGAAARRDGESLLRPKVHFFIRGLDEMVVALDGEPASPKVHLYLSLADARENCGDRRDDAFLPVLTCKCGQHFFEKHYGDLEVKRGTGNRVQGFNQGMATQNRDGADNAVWSCAPPETGTRLIMTDRLLEEVESNTPSARTSRWPEVWLCRQCGAIHRNASDQCLADGCGDQRPLLRLISFGDVMGACPSCGSTAWRIGGRVIEPARKVRAVSVSDVHILAQAMINAAPEGHQKLIIFADSRQEAAFQAGWMQDHARRIRLRHMMYRIIQASQEPISLDEITDSLATSFKQDRRLVETLLPELSDEEARSIFRQKEEVIVYRALRYMVLREFTTGIRRSDCLESMGLCRVAYEGMSVEHRRLQEFAGLLGVSTNEALDGISLILDIWRRNRILLIKSDPIYSRFHVKDNEYIQAGLLPLRDFRPAGVKLTAAKEDKYARGVIAKRGESAVQALIKKWASDPDHVDTDAAVRLLWTYLEKDARVIEKVQLLGQRDRELPYGDVWQVNGDAVKIVASDGRTRCTTCQRLAARTAPRCACTRHRCAGATTFEGPDPENYDVALMGMPFVMVAAEEHTAQVPGEVRLKIEQEFKSKQGRTNCLVATPTLEMGVNIGALDMALMRNVPPRPANYWQRAGRAGREERMAVVVTYCQRISHDRYYFDDPLRLLGGTIEAPAFNLRNPLMIEKHIRSMVLSEMIRIANSEHASAEITQSVLKQFFPFFIREYLLDDENHFRAAPPNTAPLGALLDQLQEELLPRLETLFAHHWPEEAHVLVTRSEIKRTLLETGTSLTTVLIRLHRRLQWARTTRQELHRRKDAGLIEREEEQLLRRCEEFIHRIVRLDSSTYTLTVLGGEGFLPGYGVYEGGITASARRGFAQHAGPRSFELSRNNVVALREFVPGNRLYANRGTFYVSRYHLGAEDSATTRTLNVDAGKGYVTDQSNSAAYGQTGGIAIDALPITDLDLAHESRISDDEQLRFSMPVLVLGRLRMRNRGGRGIKIGDQEVLHLRGQGIQLVNVGESSRAKANDLGHWVCTVCGAAKTPYAVQAEISHYLGIHTERCGRAPTRIALTAEADVDALQFLGMDSDIRAVNTGEAIRTAASRLLDMGEGDLQLLVVRQPNDAVDLLIYDPMPGGSGLLDQLISRWSELVREAKDLLANCPMQCEAACYSCLKTFRNQFYHEQLNRTIAFDLMTDLDQSPSDYRDIPPVHEEDAADPGSPSNTREAQLYRLLHDHHFPPGKCREAVRTSAGLTTWPDWLYEDSKAAVYLDGMSRHLHGDPATAQRDQLIRQMLELDGYRVLVIQSRDLNDPEAMRQHLRNIAAAIGRPEIMSER